MNKYNITLNDFRVKEIQGIKYYEFKELIGGLNCTIISTIHRKKPILVQIFEGRERINKTSLKAENLTVALTKINEYFQVYFFELQSSIKGVKIIK